MGQLTIADLAGAERVMQSKVGESGKKESGNINRSLHVSYLEINALINISDFYLHQYRC